MPDLFYSLKPPDVDRLCSPLPAQSRDASILVVDKMSIPILTTEASLPTASYIGAIVHHTMEIFVGLLSFVVMPTFKTGNAPCSPLKTAVWIPILTDTTP